MPEPILTGRNIDKPRLCPSGTAAFHTQTDLDSLLSDAKYPIYFDAQVTPLRFGLRSQGAAGGKHVYCEKPIAPTLSEAMELVRLAQMAKVKNGAVQDKLWVPGICKLRHLIDLGFFGRILSVRGEFGYWVFTGEDSAAQRPSWNYRSEDGGGSLRTSSAIGGTWLTIFSVNVTSVSMLGCDARRLSN